MVANVVMLIDPVAMLKLRLGPSDTMYCLLFAVKRKGFTFFADYFTTAKVVWQFFNHLFKHDITQIMRKCFFGNEGEDS